MFDLGSLHVEFLPEETERNRLITHAALGGRVMAVKFINSSDLPVKASSIFSTTPNINKHNHVKISPNEM